MFIQIIFETLSKKRFARKVCYIPLINEQILVLFLLLLIIGFFRIFILIYVLLAKIKITLIII